MPLRRLRRLAKKLRQDSEPKLVVGPGFSSAQDGAMAALDQSAEGAFAVLGAAVVSSWEVGLTDLSRALRGRIEDSEQSDLIERMSDALVPTESPFSGAGKRYRHAVKMGTKKALETERLEDAIAPLGEAIGVLGSAFAQGWPKTAGHMEPLFVLLGDEQSLRDAFLAHGPRLQAALDTAWRNYVDALDRIGEARNLETALVDSLEAWKDEAVRAVEISLYESRDVLVKAAEKLPLL